MNNDEHNVGEDYCLVLLIKELFSQVDEVAYLKSRSGGGKLSMQLLREMASVLKELTPAQQERYFDLLVRLSQKVEPPTTSYSEDFAEIAVEVKQRFIDRVRCDLKRSVG